MYKDILLNKNISNQDGQDKNRTVKQALLAGSQVLFDAVSLTYGPRGKNVGIQLYDEESQLTKDGVTVAKSVRLSDNGENFAVNCLKEIAKRTVERVGDGTTSSIILAHLLLKKGMELTDAGKTFSRVVFEDLQEASKAVTEYLDSKKIPAKSPEILKRVAHISSNGDTEISNMIGDAMEQLGENGNIHVETTKQLKTTLLLSDGMIMLSGFMTPYFSNQTNKQVCELENPYVLVSSDKIFSESQICNIMDRMYKEKKTVERNNSMDAKMSLIVIAPEIKEAALNFMITNKLNGKMDSCAIKIDGPASFIDEYVQDLLKVTGGTAAGEKFSKHLGAGCQQLKIHDLGRVSRAIIQRDRTILIPYAERIDEMKNHAEYLKELMNNEDNVEYKAYLAQRVGRMADGVAFLQIGGLTDQSTSERADRIEDAVCASIAARKSGVIPGGGMGYLYAAKFLEDKLKEKGDSAGYKILIDSLREMIRILYRDLAVDDLDSKISLDNLDVGTAADTWSGFNLQTNEEVNLFEKGILDPVDVNIETVRNSVSIASLLLNTEALILHSKEVDMTFPNPQKFQEQIGMMGRNKAGNFF